MSEFPNPNPTNGNKQYKQTYRKSKSINITMKKDIKSFQVQIILMLILSIIHISVTVYFFFHGFRLNENRNRLIVFPSCDISLIVLFVGSFSDTTKLFSWETLEGQSVDAVLSVINDSDFLTLLLRNFSNIPFFLISTNGALDLDVDWLRDTEVVSFLLCSAILMRVPTTGYLFFKPCITFLFNRTCETNMKNPCREFAITKIYWNTSAFSLTARIPNNQVTPNTGRSVPRDRNPDVAFFCSEDFVIALEAHNTLTSEMIISTFETLIIQTGMINM